MGHQSITGHHTYSTHLNSQFRVTHPPPIQFLWGESKTHTVSSGKLLSVWIFQTVSYLFYTKLKLFIALRKKPNSCFWHWPYIVQCYILFIWYFIWRWLIYCWFFYFILSLLYSIILRPHFKYWTNLNEEHFF